MRPAAQWGGWREAGSRLALLPLLGASLAVPGWVLATAPAIPLWLRAGLLALTALAALRPQWSPAVLIGLVPLLPIWPTLVPAVPDGIVHLVVATQALPWIVIRLRGRRGDGTSMAPGWGVFVGVATVSFLASITPEPWRGFDLPHVWRLLQTQVPEYIFAVDHAAAPSTLRAWTALMDGLLCVLIVGWAATRATRERTLRAAAVAAILTALFGMVQAWTGLGLQTAWLVFDSGITRINATYIDPNALAAFYALTAPVLVGLAMRSTAWTRTAWASGAVLVFAAVVMTAGRAGLVALGTGLLTMVGIGLRHGLDTIDPSPFVQRSLRRGVRLVVVVVLVVVAGVAALGTALDVRHEQQTSYVHTWLYTFNLRQPPDAIAKGRIAVWQVALRMIEEHPLTGQGLGNAPGEFERVRATLGIESLPRDARLSPHNTYLLVASELGALGLAAFVLMLAAVVIGVRAPGNLMPRTAATWPVAGLVGGLVGYTLTMLTGDRILLREDVVVGTLCAALATLGAPPLPRAWRVTAVGLLLVACASWPVRTGWIGGRAALVAAPPHEGLHPDQLGARGETYRWTTGDAVLHVPAEAWRVRIPVRNLSPQSQRLEVAIDGRPADRRLVDSGPWVVLDYRLPPHPDGRWHAIRLQVSPTWQVPGDARVLGVVVGEWGYETR